MDSKKKARCPPSKYCTLCFEVATRTSIPASSIRRSRRSASNGIEGATCLTASSMTKAPCETDPQRSLHCSRVGEREPAIIHQRGAIRPCPRGVPANGVAACRRRHDVSLPLFRLDAGDLDGFPPQGNARGDHRRELFGGVAERIDAERGKPLGECRVLGGPRHLFRDPV